MSSIEYKTMNDSSYIGHVTDLRKILTHNLWPDETLFSHWAGNGAIAELEARLKDRYGCKYALCVDNATNGLLYLLMATGLKRQEIVAPALSYGGTIAGAMLLDCNLHFVDVDETLNIDPARVVDVINNNDPKAVIGVDFGGNPHKVEELGMICSDNNIWYFVDAAQSVGCDYHVTDDVLVWADAIVLSFGVGKTLYAGGEGGAILTNNKSLYNNLIRCCQHPHRQERDLGIGFSNEFALNGRMHPLAARAAVQMFTYCLNLNEEKIKLFMHAIDLINNTMDEQIVRPLPQRGSTFYHCLLEVNDMLAFNRLFNNSDMADIMRLRVANLLPLPVQLHSAGMDECILSASYPYLEEVVNKIVYLELLNPEEYTINKPLKKYNHDTL